MWSYMKFGPVAQEMLFNEKVYGRETGDKDWSQANKVLENLLAYLSWRLKVS